MNARQKAKYYKKLYEQSKYLPNIDETSLKHHRTLVSVSNDMSDEIKLDYITRKMIDKSIPILKNSIKIVDRDYFGDIYSLEFWVK